MLERLWKYGEDNGWVMGQGRLEGADTIMNPSMISTLAQLIYRLGGADNSSRHIPTFWGVKRDSDSFYVNRLTALHLVLRREAYGYLGLQAQRTAKVLAETWPTNPLMVLVANNQCKAGKLAASIQVPPGVHSDTEYVYERIFVLGRLGLTQSI